MHNGLNREYIYYAPANLQVDAPLVFVAHGFTGSAQGTRVVLFIVWQPWLKIVDEGPGQNQDEE